MRRWRLSDGRTLAEAPSLGKAQYYKLDREGEVERVYSESATRVHEELHRMSFVVLSRQLMRRHVIERDSGSPEDHSGVELDGLTQLTAAEAPTPDEVREAIARHAAGGRVAVEEQQKEVDRIVEAAGAGARVVARGLAERIVRHDDDMARAMLASLRSLAELHRGGRGSESLRAATEAIALAARTISFEQGLPDPARPPPAIDDTTRALVDKLDALRDQLRAAGLGAPGQTSEAGRTYRRAAELLRLAIHHLLIAGGGGPGEV